MRLAGSGASVDLQVAGYQFPDVDTRPDIDPTGWDANWLIITGSVRTAGDVSWSFRDPALTTWEAADAVMWLRRVADGAAPAADVQDTQAVAWEELDSAGWLTFTEPNLGFAVGGYDGQQVQLLVGLGHESAEPSRDPMKPRRCQIALVMSRQQVHDAAAALEQELAAHPAR